MREQRVIIRVIVTPLLGAFTTKLLSQDNDKIRSGDRDQMGYKMSAGDLRSDKIM